MRFICLTLAAILMIACNTLGAPPEHSGTVAAEPSEDGDETSPSPPEPEYVPSTSVEDPPRLLHADWKRLDRTHIGWIAVVDHGPIHRSCVVEISLLDNEGFLLAEDSEHVSGTGIVRVRGQTLVLPDLAKQVAGIEIDGSCS